MAKKEIEEKKIPAPRYAVYFIDQVTKIQIGAATDELDKFTKTDLMKMVEVFKEEVEKENEKTRQSAKRRNREISKRVRRPRKVSKSE